LGKAVEIGKNSTLENCEVEEAIILENCHIKNARIRGCIIDKNCIIEDVDLDHKMIRAGSRIQGL
jgi:ADP-glucose pyrophosphorylase